MFYFSWNVVCDCSEISKKITKINKIITWILVFLFIIISFITQFKYTSLGTNLINFSFF